MNHQEPNVARSLALTVPHGAARRLIVEHVGDLLTEAHAILTRENSTADSFSRAVPHRLARNATHGELRARVRAQVAALAEDFPHHDDLRQAALSVIEQALPLRAWQQEDMDAYYRVVANFARLFAPEPAAGSRTCVKWVPDGLLIQLGASIDADSAADRESRFVRSVSSIIHECRVARRNPTVDERIATEVAYWLLKQGTRVPGPFPTWGVSGRRPIQTLVSITDPGEGHISGTTADPDHLRG